MRGGGCRTFQFHAGVEALFKSTGRTLFACGDGDGTGGAAEADVVLLVLDRPLEESLAALAREDAVMEAGNLVAADRARTVDELLPGNARLGSQRRRVLGQIRRIQSALLLARSFAAAVVVLRLVGRQTQSARWMLLMLMLMLVLVVVVMVVMMAGSTSRLAFDLQVSNAGQ
jgi:hypothetical protein